MDASADDVRTLRDGADLNCVKPGTPGNEIGVGAYCERMSDCKMTLCTGLFGAPSDAWFCSKLCTTTSECGSGAVCISDPRGTACVPMICIKDSGVEASTDAPSDSPADSPGD